VVLAAAVDFGSNAYRGRDTYRYAPPAHSRTCGFPAYGFHLGYLTAKRWLGHGCWMRGWGSHCETNFVMSDHSGRSF
jgi:hypothetical protein